MTVITEGPTRLAVVGLSETGKAVDIPVFESLLTSPAEPVRNAALAGIARLDPPVAERHAYALVEDESPRVARSAITILAGRRDTAGPLRTSCWVGWYKSKGRVSADTC